METRLQCFEEENRCKLGHPGSSQERPYGDYPYDHPGSDRSKVLAEMELEIQVPGVRVVADPLFTTMGKLHV